MVVLDILKRNLEEKPPNAMWRTMVTDETLAEILSQSLIPDSNLDQIRSLLDEMARNDYGINNEPIHQLIAALQNKFSLIGE